MFYSEYNLICQDLLFISELESIGPLWGCYSRELKTLFQLCISSFELFLHILDTYICKVEDLAVNGFMYQANICLRFQVSNMIIFIWLSNHGYLLETFKIAIIKLSCIFQSYFAP